LQALGLAGDFLGAFVVAEVNEFRVAQDAAGGPFGEFDFGNDFGFEPDVMFHVFGGGALGPGGRPPVGPSRPGGRTRLSGDVADGIRKPGPFGRLGVLEEDCECGNCARGWWADLLY